jgi:hypothetical protein
MLVYRAKLREFLLRLTPREDPPTVNRTVDESSRVGREYL